MHGYVVTDTETSETAPRGIPGIAVSNGTDVVETDDQGRFELPDTGRFVTLTRPTGFTADPWWVRATAGEIRFTLTPQEQPLPYSFAHLTDTHMTVPADHPAFDPALLEAFGLYREGSLPQQIVDFLAELPRREPQVRSVMITGDLVDHGRPAEYELYTEALATSPLPVHVIPGNHDHMTDEHGMFVSRNNYLTNAGTVENYERFVGPRWYSFDVAGLHVVAMDWHSHELGIDHDEQNAWLRNDLARRTPGSPWILLFHDQPNASLLDHVPWQPIAAFSGHWHTSRVVEVDGALHVNSPTTFFASLDYSPPAFRVITWDGETIGLRTETVLVRESPVELDDVSTATFSSAPARRSADAVLWRSPLVGASHRQSVLVDGDLVVAGSQIEDRAAGTVEAFDLASGERVWRADTRSAVKTTPVVSGGLVIAAEVSGDVTAYDRATGEFAWRVDSSDPLRRFAWGGPATANGLVYLGDQSDLRAIDAARGAVVWRRDDLSPHHNLVNHSTPLIVGDLLVMGFWPTPQHPVGLDARTGESVWAGAPVPDEVSFEAMKQLLIMGTAVHDPQRDLVLMPAFGHSAAVERATGRVVWATAHRGGFSPSAPVVTAAGYVATSAGVGLQVLEPETGEILREIAVEGDAPFPMSSYTKTPHPVVSAPLSADGTLLLSGLDGVIRRLDPASGAEVGRAQLHAPIASTLTEAGELFVGVGTDGGVFAVSRSVAS
ncbi:outer membrane protein assembly factor BamB family protein [Leifsonia poae]|uniref:outer membrane protein assembly factor BamB family protein n=1 Tax=Leifsonia poae TaxID=110933 RepID=UPI001CBC2B7E|nr:PQQ-binding-like beta-propeller repeat protein [Leifsonia poae]